MGAATQGGIPVSYPGQLCDRGQPRRRTVAGNRVFLEICSVWKLLPVLKFNSQIHRNRRIAGLGKLGGGDSGEQAEETRVRSRTETSVSGRRQPFLWGCASPEGDVSPWLQVLALLNVG